MAATARRKNTANKTRRKPVSARRATRKPRSGNGSRGLISRAQHALSGAVSGDVTDLRNEVGTLVSDLEDRLHRLNTLTKRGAGHAVDGVNDLVSGAVSGLTDHVRHGARSMTDDAAKFGDQALRRVSKEIDRRPLMTLAIAVGIGVLVGLTRRAD